ncbi:uncharacterized protein LOC144448488 [Glandiceps talaboti]
MASRRKIDGEPRFFAIAITTLGVGTTITGIVSAPVCGTGNSSRFLLLGMNGVLCALIGNFFYSSILRRRDEKTFCRFLTMSLFMCVTTIVMLILICIQFVQRPCHGVDETAIAFVAIEAKLYLLSMLVSCSTPRGKGLVLDRIPSMGELTRVTSP